MASVKVPQQKVILCGEYGVGKSSLFRRYAFNTFVSSTKRQSTLGLDHFNREYNVKGKSMRVSYSLIKIQMSIGLGQFIMTVNFYKLGYFLL